MVDAVSAALITASFGLAAAVVAKMRCRFLVNTADENDWEWSLACGFTDMRLPTPGTKSLEIYPLESDVLYLRRSD
jgi:hypothetical protein